MSTALAFAGVTALLQDMLANRLAEDPVAAAVGSVTISALPPDRVALGETSDPTQVNVFLHQVTPNQGWSNLGQPTRGGSGDRLSSPPLALDLHYLITAYAAQALRTEILLARIAQTFHEVPVPTRAAITQALAPSAPPAGFPPGLAATGLADQFEHLRITPEAMSNEELSKLWSALQARYRPTLAYRVTTVLIDSDLGARQALPALRPATRASGQPRPVILAVEPEDGPLASVVPGSRVVIRGTALVAPQMRLLVGDADLTASIAEQRPDRLVVALPDPGPLPAGALPVSIRHQAMLGSPPTLRDAQLSNRGILVLQPAVTAVFAQSAEVIEDGVTLRDGTLTLTVAPEVGRSQRVGVVLNATDGSGLAYSFRAPDGNGMPPAAPASATVPVPVRRVAAGTYLLRVQVDAADSPLEVATDGTFNGPTVTL